MNEINFELGEDIRNDNRLKQDQKWANAVSDGRVHLSNREANIFYRSELIHAIDIYYLINEIIGSFNNSNSYFKLLNHEMVRMIFEFAYEGSGPVVTTCVYNQFKSEYRQLQENNDLNNPFRICIRKRPIMNWEKEMNAYDIVNSNNLLYNPLSNMIAIHNGKLARNGRQLSMSHHHFFVSRYFSEFTSNTEVANDAIEPHIKWAENGKDSTIMFYGQTGTGKTYSMLGTLNHIATRLHGMKLMITFYEIRGKKCYDLLNNRNLVHIRSDDQNNVHVRGCRTITFESMEKEEFLITLHNALSLRTTAETERNPISSRSHAICTIELCHNIDSIIDNNNNNNNNIDNVINTSKIRLVDLAGSERNYETWAMTAEDHRDSADINFTLMALKDCFRAYNYERTGKVPIGSLTGFAMNSSIKQKFDEDNQKSEIILNQEFKENYNNNNYNNNHNKSKKKSRKNVITTGSRFTKAPYRASLLTRILRECFISGSLHKTTIIATISPTPTDLEHTLNTLEHVCMMDETLQELSSTTTVELSMGMASNAIFYDTPVHEWNNLQLSTWLSCAEGGRFSHLALPPGINGSYLLSQEAASLSIMFTGELRQARNENEGGAWIEEVDLNKRQNAIGKALWRALRREQQAYVTRKRTNNLNNNNNNNNNNNGNVTNHY